MENNQTEPAQTTATTHIVLACDESGAKGYADRDEATPGETGVFAGLMVPADYLDTVAPDFDAIAQEYASDDGKLHITDLPTDRQHALREDIYALIMKHKIPCFYEAVHVAGFHRAYTEHKQVVDQARAARNSRIKMGSPRSIAPSLHVALFQGLYGKIIAFCLERETLRLHIEVRTDRVDAPLVKNFEDMARDLLAFGAKIERVTGFDQVQKKVVEGTIEIGAPPENAQIPVVVEQLDIRTVDDSDGLVVAADVLANSLDYLFRNRTPEERYRPLNDPEAFKTTLSRLVSTASYDGTDITSQTISTPIPRHRHRPENRPRRLSAPPAI